MSQSYEEHKAKKQQMREASESARTRRKSAKKILLGLVILISVGVVVFLISLIVNNANADPFVVESNDWVKGPHDAQVVIFEYSDFQCPACAFYAPLISQALSDFPQDVRVIYRHLPLVSIHPNATLAAQAAEAAGIQGKFWEMHDALFANQDAWSRSATPEDFFVTYARALELDTKQFTDDLRSSEVTRKVRRDMRFSSKLGLSSTPSILINGTKITNPQEYEDFKLLIQNEIGF